MVRTISGFTRWLLLFTPLIVLGAFAHLALPPAMTSVYISVMILAGLTSIVITSLLAKRTYRHIEFCALAHSFLLFALLFLCAELGWLLLRTTATDHVAPFYMVHAIWLIGYAPLAYSLSRTLLHYAEYADPKRVLLTTVGVYSAAVAILLPLGVIVLSSNELSEPGMKLLAVVYPYFDCIILLLLFLLLYIYHTGRLAFYWSAVTAGMLIFTVGDLLNAFLTGIGATALLEIPASFFIVAYFYLAFGFGAVAYARRAPGHMEPGGRYTVEQIFLIHKYGLLITHVGRDTRVIDSEIVGGMLSAIRDFISDSLRDIDEEAKQLRRLQYGGLEIHVENGERVFLAMVIEGEGTKWLHHRMREAIAVIEAEYGPALEKWDGEKSAFDALPAYLRASFF